MDIKELTGRLREAAAEARELGNLNADLFVQQLHQLLNSYESTKITAQREKDSLMQKVGQCEGMIKAAGQHQDLLVATLEAYNRQERKAREEQARFEAEQQEKLDAQKAAGTDTVEMTPEQIAENSTPTAKKPAKKKAAKKRATKKSIRIKGKGGKGAEQAD
jgi:hypothetical protein